MSKEKVCELDIRIPFETWSHAKTISEVLKVDTNQPDRVGTQTITIKDDSLCMHFTAPRVKDIRSCSTSFFEAYLLCDEMIRELGTPDC